MNKTKYVFYAIIACVTFVALGGRVFAAAEVTQRPFIVKFIVEDKRTGEKKSSAQELKERFVLKLSNNYVDRDNNPTGGKDAMIGTVKKGSTFDLEYKMDNGSNIVVFKNAPAWGEYDKPIDFALPVSASNHSGEKNKFGIVFGVFPETVGSMNVQMGGLSIIIEN